MDPRLYPAFVSPAACQHVIDEYAKNGQRVASTLLEFLGSCDGRRPLSAIISALDGDQKAALLRMIHDLVQAGAILDVRAIYRMFYESSKNPPIAPPAFSAAEVEDWTLFCPPRCAEPLMQPDGGLEESVGTLSFSRHSAPLDDFLGGGGSPVLMTNLAECLRRAYRLAASGRTVASAGGLYPVVIYIALPAADNPGEAYTCAWYDPFSGDIRKVADRPLTQLVAAFPPDPSVQLLLTTGVGLMFICCDTSRACAKYGNRGYRFALLEAGAVWQNIDLTANGLGIPIRAFGGFIDDQCSELLSLPEHVHPLLTVLVGS